MAVEPVPNADARALELAAGIRDLRLSEDEQRWMIAALRDLQLDRERVASGQRRPADDDEDLAGFLLGQPAAQRFSGRQRDGLRAVFGETDPLLLRDVATLLASTLGSSGGEDLR